MARSLALILALGACTPDDAKGTLNRYPDATIATEQDALDWATIASAPNAFYQSYLPYFLIGRYGGAGCPAVTETEAGRTYTGDCTDADGRTWLGVATESETEITYDSFGYAIPSEACGGEETALFHGGITGVEQAGALDFTLDLLVDVEDFDDDCHPESGSIAILYGGTRAGGDSGPEVWNGAGELGSSEWGRVEAETVEEVIADEVCPDEALSGTTTITAGRTTLVITYDGETDCDPASTVQWSLDGEAQGELRGVSCASGPRGGAWALGLVLLLLGGRRR